MTRQVKTKSLTTSGSIPTGCVHVEFIVSADFVGVINGQAMAGTGAPGVPALDVYGVDAPPGDILTGFDYTMSAGGGWVTYF